MIVTVYNCGSSSFKYEIFNVESKLKLLTGLIEKIGGAGSELQQQYRKEDGSYAEEKYTKPIADHRQAFDFMAEVNEKHRLMHRELEIFGIGHRVVHGGQTFQRPVLIDEHVIAEIRNLIPLAPLHNPMNLLGIEIAREQFPLVPHVAVFDTAFHQTLPPFAYRYAVPQEMYETYHVRKYGFHGTSHSYVSKVAAKHLGKAIEDANLITLHLGNGASATAVQKGQSVDTSMGMTPLEGLIMGTRCGDIDPSLHFHMIRHSGMAVDVLEGILNRESGLKGICGSNDMREILEQATRGNQRAKLAIEMFCYRAKKYIGAYLAILGKTDAIVFTGGIGENAAWIRQKVCEGLEHMGIMLHDRKNETAAGSVFEIQQDTAPIKILVIQTDEEWEIAEQTVHTIQNRASNNVPKEHKLTPKGKQ